jgi:hypothetical protein
MSCLPPWLFLNFLKVCVFFVSAGTSKGSPGKSMKFKLFCGDEKEREIRAGCSLHVKASSGMYLGVDGNKLAATQACQPCTYMMNVSASAIY